MPNLSPISSHEVTADVANQSLGFAPPDVADVIGIARRGWLLIAVGTVVGLIFGLALVSLRPPMYKASARMVIEKSLNRYMQTNKLVDEPVFDDADTLGQIYIISSDSVILPVVRSLDLTRDPDFVGSPDDKSLNSRVHDLADYIKGIIGFKVNATGDRERDLERLAVDSVIRNLTVAREDTPSVISISFESKDAQKAAKIANAIAATYVESNVTGKVNSVKITSKLMQDRVAELKQQAANADRALLEFRTANSLGTTADTALTHAQLYTLNTHLLNARMAMADARARLERLKQMGTEAGAGVTPDNELITKLRAQYLDLASRATDIENLVGKDHLAAVKLRKRMEDVNAAIASEQKRLSSTFDKDFALASARYDEIAMATAQVLGEEGSNGQVNARVRELESAAEALRTLYNSALQRFTEMNKADPHIIPDARIITRAAVPLQTESSKKRLLVLAGGTLFGMLLGGGLVFARDFPLGVFRTPEQIRQATGLFCAVLPTVKPQTKSKPQLLGEYILDNPYSRFTESIRNVWTLVYAAQHENAAKVFCVVSSVPKEGKTTVASNLASHIASHAGARALLIDADFHQQSLTQTMTPEARRGLKEALDDPALLSELVVKKERSRLDVLPCPVERRIPNAAELLGSPKMEKLIDAARSAYDIVIIEAPPIAAVADFSMISRFCDGFIFTVEWGKTSQRLVLESLSEASVAWNRMLCVVLNKADPKALKDIEHYKGNRFHAYYQDGNSA